MTAKKRGRGRPKVKNPATAVIRFRVTPAEKAKYRRVAENCDMTVSEWIRQIANIAAQ
jgi:antitoxin component of RelBE/YafQ-DinJ toxin-antitoxin module